MSQSRVWKKIRLAKAINSIPKVQKVEELVRLTTNIYLPIKMKYMDNKKALLTYKIQDQVIKRRDMISQININF